MQVPSLKLQLSQEVVKAIDAMSQASGDSRDEIVELALQLYFGIRYPLAAESATGT